MNAPAPLPNSAHPVVRFPQIAARVFNTPLLIEQTKLDAILRVLGPRLGFDTGDSVPALGYARPEDHAKAARGLFATLAASSRVRVTAHDEGYLGIGRLAVVPIIGSLIQRSDWMAESSGMMSYARIERAFLAALADPDAEEVILELDSPGGEVAGAFDLADRIYAARGEKPIVAVANEYAASAAYLLASADDEIVLPRTGAVGSVGVVAAHFDYSAAMEKKGVAVTWVYAGDKKVDGNPYEPLSDRARDDWQSDIDALYTLFINTVARNRGLAHDDVRGTQAGIFMGHAAVKRGLADRIDSFAGELSTALSRPGGALRLIAAQPQEPTMTQQTTTGGATNPARSTSAAASSPESTTTPAANATTGAAASDERSRIRGILTHAEASGRQQLAEHLAYDTSMSVEDAVALLSKAPKDAGTSAAAPASASKGPSELRAAMAANGTPGIPGQEANGAPEKGSTTVDTAAIYTRRNQGSRSRMARYTTRAQDT